MTGTPALAVALAEFQAQMPTVAKSKRAEVPTKNGGKYTYTYADLSDVTEAAMPLLTQCGLSFTAEPEVGERGLALRGVLMHKSGEERTGTLPLSGNSPQELGSSLTYMRRYLFGCLTGIVTDDDDDGRIAQAAATKRATQRQAPRQAPRETGEAITEAQGRALHAAFGSAGISDRDARLSYCQNLIGRPLESSKDLTKAEASKVIEALKSDADEADQQWRQEGA